MKTLWKSFNIRMPQELIPLYDFMQGKLNRYLSDESLRKQFSLVNLSQHRGNVVRDIYKILKSDIKQWTIVSNKVWYGYILCENIRRLLQSNSDKVKIFRILKDNNFKITESLFETLHSNGLCSTRGLLVNLSQSRKEPVLAKTSTFVLDYSISYKSMFVMSNSYLCRIQTKGKEWVEYQIYVPSSVDHRVTGRIAKPRFIKTSDGKYIGNCTYECKSMVPTGNNILGVDLGKIKAYSAVVLSQLGEHSQEFSHSNRVEQMKINLENLYKEKYILNHKIKLYNALKLVTDKYFDWKRQYANISKKIVNTKKTLAKQIAFEVCNLAYNRGCNKIHLENLAWLGSKGGKWHHSEIQNTIEQQAEAYGLKVIKVLAKNTSKQHPITEELGSASGRLIKFKNKQVVDRDLLAAVNLASRNQGKKPQNKVTKLKSKVRTDKTKVKSRRRAIKEFVKSLKESKRGNSQIVLFSPRVSEPKLEAWPWKQVNIHSSLLLKQFSNNEKLQL